MMITYSSTLPFLKYIVFRLVRGHLPNNMVLILVLGDLHIPHRAAGIPEPFRKMFAQSGRIHQIISCGNLCDKETYEYLRTITTDITCVRGEYDEYPKDLKEVEILEIEDLKFGVIHGHQVVPWGDKDSLALWQRKLDVDVLISGNTFSSKIFSFDGKLFANPGTITGASSSFDPDTTPQFLLLDVQDNRIMAFTYSMEEGEMRIKKKEWTKGE